MREHARKEAIDYIKTAIKMSSTTLSDPAVGVDRFLEYFTILPVDLDPNGLVRKWIMSCELETIGSAQRSRNCV